MIHITDPSELWQLERGERFGCVLLHEKDDSALLDRISPIADGLERIMMHVVINERTLLWMKHNDVLRQLPLVILFQPNEKPKIIYRPSLQQVVDLCIGRAYTYAHQE